MKKKRSNQIKHMAPSTLERQECTIYSRVVGWLTPVKNYNRGKAAEYRDRVPFVVEDCNCQK